MNKIYLITYIEWASYSVLRAVSSKEKAEQIVEELLENTKTLETTKNNFNIFEMNLD